MPCSAPEQHIMISYSWKEPAAAKEIMTELKNQLERNGYKVWMDVDAMRGNVYEAMAQAVTNSFVVLACVTPGYQKSDNCQKEILMACEEKKPIIPIKVMDSFRAEGWLKAAIAGLFYYKIPTVDAVKQKLPDVITEIERIRENAAEDGPGFTAIPRDDVGAVQPLNQENASQHDASVTIAEHVQIQGGAINAQVIEGNPPNDGRVRQTGAAITIQRNANIVNAQVAAQQIKYN